jgi:hypothetical protein
VSGSSLEKRASRSSNYPDSAHGIPKFTAIGGKDDEREQIPIRKGKEKPVELSPKCQRAITFLNAP